jgi:membrane protein required for colicin V production
VDIQAFLTSLNKFDLLVLLAGFGMFVLGFIQGTIRRVLGIAAMLFSFLFAANLRDPLGGYLASEWNQFPDEYAMMLGFGIVFVTATIAFTLIIQGFYHKQALFKKNTLVDEVIGGVLGVVELLFFVGAGIVILDSFFTLGLPETPSGELGFLRSIWTEMNASQTAVLFRDTLIPGFIAVFGFVLPDFIKVMYR